jgi:tRNA threonylcarbamoyladenosine biosynthesis protein TsaB
VRILAVDTATERGSVALLLDGEVAGEVRFRPRESHSVSLLPAIAFLLGQEGLGPGDLQGFAVTLGPGSFTGVRVGISTVQGLALAAGRPAVGLPTLDVLAARVAGAAPRLVAAVDAYRGEVFAGVYDREARPVGAPQRLSAEAFVEGLPEDAVLIGDGALKYADRIAASGRCVAITTRSLFLAGTLARVSQPLFEAGRGGPPSALRPLYLREADIRP